MCTYIGCLQCDSIFLIGSGLTSPWSTQKGFNRLSILWHLTCWNVNIVSFYKHYKYWCLLILCGEYNDIYFSLQATFYAFWLNSTSWVSQLLEKQLPHLGSSKPQTGYAWGFYVNLGTIYGNDGQTLNNLQLLSNNQSELSDSQEPTMKSIT